jgi:hypothetical protein
MKHWLVATILVCGTIFASFPGTARAASAPAFLIRNATSEVAYVEIDQLTPYSRLTRLYVNPRRTEARYLSLPLGKFEIRVTVNSGGHKIVLRPKQLFVHNDKAGHITIFYIATGEHADNLDFDFAVSEGPQ